jgi:hypothetical protein
MPRHFDSDGDGSWRYRTRKLMRSWSYSKWTDEYGTIIARSHGTGWERPTDEASVEHTALPISPIKTQSITMHIAT